MYTLLSGLYKHLTLKEQYCIIILGLDNAGKTTLLEKIKHIYMGVRGLAPHQINPTVGLNVGRVMIGNILLKFWDLGGHEDLQGIWEKYYSECHGVLFVIDSNNPTRLEECRDTFNKVVSNEAIEGVPVLMLANKQDCPGAMQVEDIKQVFNQIAVRLDAMDSRVLPISALSGYFSFDEISPDIIREGVREAVEWMLARIVHNRSVKPPIYSNR